MVWHLDVGSSHPGAGEGPKGWAVRPLKMTQPYVAEKMGVTASTILRYENGSIDNTKKMVLEGLSEALHVSVEWLKGETDEYETDITDKRELQIRDAMGDILEQLPLALTKEEDA